MTDNQDQATPEPPKSLNERVLQFHKLELPGQPMMMHMGTSYLVSDLAARVTELEHAIIYAHVQLEPGEECPRQEQLADSLQMLAAEQASWIKVAVEHNKQCPQLHPATVPLPEAEMEGTQ